MTPELLMAIAALCGANGHGNASFGGETYDDVFRKQLACQKEYITCVKKSLHPSYPIALANCVLDKK